MGKVYVSNGHWRFKDHADIIFKCPYPPSCRGVDTGTLWFEGIIGNQSSAKESCAKNYYGNLCSRCQKGYAKLIGGMCEICSPYYLVLVFIAVLFMILLFVIAYYANKGPRVNFEVISSHPERLRNNIQVDSIYAYISETIGNTLGNPLLLAVSNDKLTDRLQDNKLSKNCPEWQQSKTC